MPSIWPSVVSSPQQKMSLVTYFSSRIANPLFFFKFKPINLLQSKKFIRLPSVVSSSSASKFPMANKSFKSFLSSSSNHRMHNYTILHNIYNDNSRTTSIIRSFSSTCTSVRDDEISSRGMELGELTKYQKTCWKRTEMEKVRLLSRLVREARDALSEFEGHYDSGIPFPPGWKGTPLESAGQLDDNDDDYEEGKKLEDDDDDDETEPEVIPQFDAVVVVKCSGDGPHFSSPWRRGRPGSCVKGLIMSGRRIITVAHAVDHNTQLEVRTYYGVYRAKVLALAPEYDLAILTVNDDQFWKGVKAMEFGDMPSPGDKVIIPRYQKGRDHPSLMTAHVLGCGMTRYFFWGTTLPAFEVNVGLKEVAASGPAFDERCKCVGLKLRTEGNNSDFIPAEVIKHLIQDYDKHGAYTGLPVLGIKWQKMDNPYLRAGMKMELDQQGILITEVHPNYPESMILQPYDVILSIDGININNDGTVPFLQGRRIEFSYLIGKKYNGDKIVIKVRRGSEICEFITELATHKQFVPANIIGRPCRYYIIGGFVFTTLTYPYMLENDYRYDWTPDEDELLYQALYEERVVLCQVLEADFTAGYDTEFLVQNQVVITFNNKFVEGLKSLVSMVENCNEDFMKFTFGNHKILLLPTNIARSRTSDILKAHSISCAMSDDLKELVKLTQSKESHMCI